MKPGDVVEVEGRHGIVLDKCLVFDSRPFWLVLVGTQKLWYTLDAAKRDGQWRRSTLADGFPYRSVSSTAKVVENGIITFTVKVDIESVL